MSANYFTALNERRKFVGAMCKKYSDNEEMVLADLKNRLTAENCAHEILVMSGKVGMCLIKLLN